MCQVRLAWSRSAGSFPPLPDRDLQTGPLAEGCTLQANAHGQRTHWWERLLAVTPRRYFGWAPDSAHGRRWWQRRRDIDHLLKLIGPKSWTPTREADIIRQFKVTTQLELTLKKLKPQAAPRHLMEIRGR